MRHRGWLDVVALVTMFSVVAARNRTELSYDSSLGSGASSDVRMADHGISTSRFGAEHAAVDHKARSTETARRISLEVEDSSGSSPAGSRDVVSYNPVALVYSKSEIRSKETDLGNLVCDAFRWSAPGADACLVNAGAIRADLPAGDITPALLQAVLPYGNKLVLLELTGEQLVSALENGVSGNFDSASPDSRFPQVSGLTFKYDSTAPVGSRILSVSILTSSGSAEAVDPCKTYTVVVNDFMAAGGDGYEVFMNATAVPTFAAVDAVSAVSSYAAAHNPLPSGLYGRITSCSHTPDRCPGARGVADKCNPAVGYNPVALVYSENEIRSTETALGNLVCDAFKWSAPGADACLVNGGAIRAGLPAGDITPALLQTVLPYGNTLVMLKLTGQQLVSALENGVSGNFDDTSVDGRFPQVSGLLYTYNATGPLGRRIMSASLRTASGAAVAVDPCKTYTVVVNDYMAAGGDGYSILINASVIPTFAALDAVSAVSSYSAAHNPLPSGRDGRITQCGLFPASAAICPLRRTVMDIFL